MQLCLYSFVYPFFVGKQFFNASKVKANCTEFLNAMLHALNNRYRVRIYMYLKSWVRGYNISILLDYISQSTLAEDVITKNVLFFFFFLFFLTST